MNYETKSIKNEEGFFWAVTEKDTEQTIKVFFFQDEARRFMKFLNRGGGFDGWTPAFMLREMPKTDLNEDFVALIDET